MTRDSLRHVTDELSEIRLDLQTAEARFSEHLRGVPPARRDSARNLLHYLALRRRDLRPLQGTLASLGLSSLGRAESHVEANIDAVIGHLDRLTHETPAPTGDPNEHARQLLQAHTDALFGPAPARSVRIMVTMPGEAAHDLPLVRELVRSGMDCMRVNCAHDDADVWARIVRHLRHVTEETGHRCRVLMDLAGPKLRTGPIAPGPAVVRWRPQRDVIGRVVTPARIWLTPADRSVAPPTTGAVVLPVRGDWIATLGEGDRLALVDARGARRELLVVSREAGGVWAESNKTAYIVPGTSLRRVGHGGAFRDLAEVADLPPTAPTLRLRPHDTLLITPADTPGRPAVFDEDHRVVAPASIGVTLPQVFADARPGESIWFDDGRIGGTIRTVDADAIEVEITHADAAGATLSADKGINVPDTDLRLPPLTDKDLDDLRTIATLADIVGYSFVRAAEHVHELRHQVDVLDRADLGLILKIETRRAFENLPALLLAALHSPASGVMIARGDLAVECGYERLAEVQEEILWMTEACHMPVIWATQVLERLAKDGVPSRAEVTDAAMGVRAECVMLNKGPHIVEAVRALDNILTRMRSHQQKKTALLRDLRVAERFFGPS